MPDRVLIVDDEPVIREMLKDVLEEAGYGAEVAPCAEEALKIIPHYQPDILVSDIWMPGMHRKPQLDTEVQNVYEPQIPPVTLGGVLAVTRRGDSKRTAPERNAEPSAENADGRLSLEVVPLIPDRDPSRIETQRVLLDAHVTIGSLDRELAEQGRFGYQGETGGVDPQRPCIGGIGEEEIILRPGRKTLAEGRVSVEAHEPGNEQSSADHITGALSRCRLVVVVQVS